MKKKRTHHPLRSKLKKKKIKRKKKGGVIDPQGWPGIDLFFAGRLIIHLKKHTESKNIYI